MTQQGTHFARRLRAHPWWVLCLLLVAASVFAQAPQPTTYLAFLAYREAPTAPWRAPNSLVSAGALVPAGQYGFQIVILNPRSELLPAGLKTSGGKDWIALHGSFLVDAKGAVTARDDLESSPGPATDPKVLDFNEPLWVEGNGETAWARRGRPLIAPLIEYASTQRGVTPDKSNPDADFLRAMLTPENSAAFEAPAGTGDSGKARVSYHIERLHWIDRAGPESIPPEPVRLLWRFWNPAASAKGGPAGLTLADLVTRTQNDIAISTQGAWFHDAGYTSVGDHDHALLVEHFADFVAALNGLATGVIPQDDPAHKPAEGRQPEQTPQEGKDATRTAGKFNLGSDSSNPGIIVTILVVTLLMIAITAAAIFVASWWKSRSESQRNPIILPRPKSHRFSRHWWSTDREDRTNEIAGDPDDPSQSQSPGLPESGTPQDEWTRWFAWPWWERKDQGTAGYRNASRSKRNRPSPFRRPERKPSHSVRTRGDIRNGGSQRRTDPLSSAVKEPLPTMDGTAAGNPMGIVRSGSAVPTLDDRVLELERQLKSLAGLRDVLQNTFAREREHTDELVTKRVREAVERLGRELDETYLDEHGIIRLLEAKGLIKHGLANAAGMGGRSREQVALDGARRDDSRGQQPQQSADWHAREYPGSEAIQERFARSIDQAPTYTPVAANPPPLPLAAPEPTDQARLLDVLKSLGALGGDNLETLSHRSFVDAGALLREVVAFHMPKRRPLTEYRRYDDAIRIATGQRFELIVPTEGQRIDPESHEVVDGQAVDKGQLGTVLRITLPGVRGDGAVLLRAQVIESQ